MATTKGLTHRTLISNATGTDIAFFWYNINEEVSNRMTMVDDHKKMFFYDGAQLLVATPTQDDISSFVDEQSQNDSIQWGINYRSTDLVIGSGEAQNFQRYAKNYMHIH